MADAKVGAGDYSEFLARALPGQSEAAASGVLPAARAVEIMLSATLSLYPQAYAAFAHGSAVNGRFKRHSDLDVVVLTQERVGWKKHCFVHEGYPIDMQAVGERAVRLLPEFARRTGRSLSIEPIARGAIILDRKGDASALQSAFRSILENGPSSTEEPPDQLRAMVTSRILELISNDDLDQKIAVGLSCFDLLGQLMSAGRGHWRETGKWVIGALDPRAFTFDDVKRAYAELLRGDEEPLVRLLERALEAAGGVLWAGFSGQVAPLRFAESGDGQG